MTIRFFIVCCVLSLGQLLQAQTLKPIKIAYSQIISHPALSAIYEGMIDELNDQGYVLGKNLSIDYQIAQGDLALNQQIAQKFAGGQYDLIIASTTPSAQAVIAAVKGNTPIVFTGVSDPISAKLVANLQKPGLNVTGVKESIAYDAMLETIRSLKPEAKNLGTIFNPSEDNSHSTNKILRERAQQFGMNLYVAPATNTAEVLMASKSLVGKVDVLLVTLDNTVVSALSSVLQVANNAQIPVFTFDTFSAEKGAAVGVGYDEHDVGRLTALQVMAIINGEKAGDLPVLAVEKTRIVLNIAAAKKQNLHLNKNIKAKASKIIEDKEDTNEK